jgi:hypothetical protein
MQFGEVIDERHRDPGKRARGGIRRTAWAGVSLIGDADTVAQQMAALRPVSMYSAAHVPCIGARTQRCLAESARFMEFDIR